MKPETYYCRGLPYSANLPTEMKIRYFGLACPYLMIGFSTLIPVTTVTPVPTCWVSILVNPSYYTGHMESGTLYSH